MSIKTLEILEQLKDLTLLETADLVKQIEQTFGVDASFKLCAPPTAFLNDLQPQEIPEVPIKTEFDVILDEVPGHKKIATLKAIRSLTGFGLKEAKELVNSVPTVVRSAVDADTAENIVQQLQAVGATVSLK